MPKKKKSPVTTTRARRRGKHNTAPPSDTSRASLIQELADFAASSRMPLMQHLRLDGILKLSPKKRSALAGIDLGTLVQPGAIDRLPAQVFGEEEHRALLLFLQGLRDTDSGEPDMIAAVAPRPPLSARTKNSPFMGSVESEQRLIEGLRQLATAPHFPSFANRALGEFWEKDWVRAPFEESLTFAQLARMSPRTLLEKRSFTTQKLLLILKVIDRVSHETADHASRALPSSENRNTPDDRSNRSTPGPLPYEWSGVPAAMPLHLRSMLQQFSAQVALLNPRHPLAPALVQLPATLTPHEYLASALLLEHSEEVISGLLRVDRNTVIELESNARNKIATLLIQLCPTVIDQWKLILAFPAVSTSQFIGDPGDAVDTHFIESVLSLVLKAIGATPVHAFGIPLRGYLSLDGTALEKLLTLFLSALPKDDATLRAEIATLLPTIPFDSLSELLRQKARFKEKERVWVAKGVQ